MHLGSGASMCAIGRGQSVDTTMGLTPVSGLPGATRSFRVLPNEILTDRDAMDLVLALARGAEASASIAWHDITSTFTR